VDLYSFEEEIRPDLESERRYCTNLDEAARSDKEEEEDDDDDDNATALHFLTD
jgi:hypothetical protein